MYTDDHGVLVTVPDLCWGYNLGTEIIIVTEVYHELPQALLLLPSSTFRIRPSDLFPLRIMKLWFLQRVGRTLWKGDQPVASPLPIQDNTNRTLTSMAQMGFEPKIPVFVRVKKFRASGSVETVIT
jgi:hypothetical protein